MASWTHLVRFIAVEDNKIHLGQLMNTARDVGRDSVDGREIPVYLIDGTIFNGRATKEVLHIKQVWKSEHTQKSQTEVGKDYYHGSTAILCMALTYDDAATLSYSQRGLRLYPLSWTELYGPCQGTCLTVTP